MYVDNPSKQGKSLRDNPVGKKLSHSNTIKLKGMRMIIYSVYSITCKTNNKVYFGRSQELEKRWRSHRNMLRSNSHSNMHFQDDWQKYGEEDFLFEVLLETVVLEYAIQSEQGLIDSNEYNKYNITGALNGGDTFTNNPRSESTRKLKSINSSGKNNPMYGVPKSELMLQRVREANSKKVYIEGILYPSLTKASKEIGVGITTLSYRLNSNSDEFIDWKYA